MKTSYVSVRPSVINQLARKTVRTLSSEHLTLELPATRKEYSALITNLPYQNQGHRDFPHTKINLRNRSLDGLVLEVIYSRQVNNHEEKEHLTQMRILAEMLTPIHRAASSDYLGLQAAIDPSGSVSGRYPSLTFGGDLRAKDISELVAKYGGALDLMASINNLMNLFAKR